MAIKIIADSCCDTTPYLRKELDIRLAPLSIIIATGIGFVDDLNIKIDQLLAEMKKSKEPARTACPSIEEYSRLMLECDECVVITISDKLSGSYNSARLARELVLESHPQKKIFVADSKSATAGELRLALHVHEQIKDGKSFEEVVKSTTEFISNMHTLFVLEDLSNLVKNGRMSKVEGLVASVMSLHPVLADDGHGEIKKLKVIRGLQNSLDHMVSCIADITKEKLEKTVTLTLTYCNCIGRAEILKLNILAKCKAIKEVVMAPTAGLSTVYANNGGVVIAF